MKRLQWRSWHVMFSAIIMLVWLGTNSITAAKPSVGINCSWAGRWVTDRGLTTFVQAGTTVTGTFSGGGVYPEYPAPGSFQTTLNGNAITGTWQDTAGNSGNVTLTGDGCVHFNGSWDLGDPNGWVASWEGNRVVAEVYIPLVSK